jgi:pimeloyl-ACP methyl ester carboxylesterase
VPRPVAHEAALAEPPTRIAHAGGVDLAWQEFGSGPPLVLIMGLGMQMIGWDEAFCARLAAHFHVIRFDNRDVGKSTWLDERGDPNVLEVFDRLRRKKPVEPAYRIADMAEDVAQLLDALGIARAHVAGASMGGMIAQELAIRHPERVLTLTSIMANTGEPDVQGPSYETLTALLAPFPPDRDGFIARSLEVARVLKADEARARPLAARSFDRGYHPAGLHRQLVAIRLSPGRRAALAKLKLPALVIHGEADPLVPVEGGRDTAKAIPGAKFLLLPGVGHDLPPPAWPAVIDAIVRLSQGDAAR